MREAPIKCSYDERTRRYTGRGKVIGWDCWTDGVGNLYIAQKGSRNPKQIHPGTKPPGPVLYDPKVHRSHREGHYRASVLRERLNRLVQIPPH